MGVVYEANDEANATRVALKFLPHVNPESLHRFKREFRIISDLRHPNLVRLGELVSEREHWFFTMELVNGIDLVSYSRGIDTPDAVITAPADVPGIRAISTAPALPAAPIALIEGAFDEARTRAAFAQLARALNALHGAGCVHRDVKPSNVLVTEEGRAVLLDFGLTSDTDAESLVKGAGTPEYMAPEQVSQGGITAAADWYALGVILFELLTGRLPFVGLRHEILYRKQRENAPRVADLVTSAPPDLVALCEDLLSREPAARPSGAQVLARLERSPELAGLSAPNASPSSALVGTFVGRRGELAELDAALGAVRGGQGGRAVVVHGESGIGKSTLVRAFLEPLRDRGDLVVLTARCYERELVPFKAVDGLVDALVPVLRKMPPDELSRRLPQHVALLTHAFPVLGRIPAIARARFEHGAMDPQEVRSTMFGAFRELVLATAGEVTIVAFVDDFQWADADSRALLTELLRAPGAPRLLLLATLRTATAGTDGNPRVFGDGIVEQGLSVRALPADEARSLARGLLNDGAGGEVRVDAADDGAELLVRESAGHPLFLVELARTMHLPRGAEARLTLESLLNAKIGSFPAAAAHLLRALGIAGAPTPARTLRRVAATTGETFVRLLDELRGAKLVHSGFETGDEVLDIAHDRIRHVARALAPAEEAADLHRRFAEAFEDDGELLRAAGHWREAGHKDRAAGHFAAAAQRAAAALAFDQAVQHFEAALEMGQWGAEKRRDLLVGLADALANAGRGVRAATHYLAGAEGADAKASLRLRRRGAEELLRNGRLDEGCAVAAQALAEVGLGFSRAPVRALVQQRVALRLRGLRFRQRDADAVAPLELSRIDLCWALSSGLGLMDPVQGAHFQVRSLLLALRAGEPHRIARGIAGEAAYAAAQGQVRRAERLLAEAFQLAARTKDPHAQGTVSLTSGMASHLLGRFRAGVEQLEKATKVFHDGCVGTSWELNAARHFTLECLYYLGELPKFRVLAVEGVREARDRGSVYAATTLRTGLANAVWLMEDDPRRALRETDESMAGWSSRGYHIQHWYALIARTQAELYLGDGEAAHARCEHGWRDLHASSLLRMQHTRIVAVHLRARAALLAAAGRTGPARDACLALAERAARRLAREAGWAHPLAALTRAGIHHARGDEAHCRQWLLRASAEASAHGLAMFKGAADLAAAALAGRPDEAGVREAWSRDLGIQAPAAFARMLAPGVPMANS
jgi:hypothetical protein